jgi:hypothetical protein
VSAIEPTAGRGVALAVEVLWKVMPALREIAVHENLAITIEITRNDETSSRIGMCLPTDQQNHAAPVHRPRPHSPNLPRPEKPKI